MSQLQQDLSSLRLPEPGALNAARRRRWPIAVGVLVLLVAGLAWRSVTASVDVETTTAVIADASAAPPGSPMLTAAGYLVARRRAVVSAKIQGRLAELKVEEGSRVAEGEIFARLESADFQAAVTRARAALASADAQVTSTQAAVASADAQIARAEADLAEARRQAGIAERLGAEKVVSVDQVDAAKSRVKVTDAVVGQVKADAGKARADVARTTAAREQARADLAYNEALLQNTVIRAPFSGTVVKKMAEVGESVAPIPPGVNISTASGAIAALADLETLEVEVEVAEANVARLVEGQPAEVAVEAFPDRKYTGTLRQVIPTADRTRATVNVKVTIADTDARLKPEMSAKVTFLEPKRAPTAAVPAEKAVFVPESAVASREGKSTVFIVANGRCEARVIVTGAKRLDRLIVKSGLTGGEVLVNRPAADLKSGGRVRVKGA